MPHVDAERRSRAPNPYRGLDHSHLTPLVGPPKRSRFCTWDLESKDGPSQRAGFTRIFLAGLYDGQDYTCFFDQPTEGKRHWQRRPTEPGGCVDRLMRSCLQKAYAGYWFYAHNAGNFDFLHLLPWLMRQKRERDLQISLMPLGSSGLLAIDVWKTDHKWHRWRFVDSVRLLPMTLKLAGESFSKGRKSHDQKGNRILDRHGQPFTIDAPEDDPGWPAYNEQDCRLLYDVLERVHELVELELGGEVGLTVPSTSIKTFRRAHLKQAIPREVHTHAFIRRSYVGGRTEVFEELGHHLSYFDVNSSYVHQMTLPLPAGESRIWEKGEPPEHWREGRIGFCEVTVHVPDDLQIPPLPVKANPEHFPEGSGVEGKLVFPTGTLVGIWEWGELQNAVECGCEITDWKQSIWYESKPLLREYVEILYKYRNQSKCYTCSSPLGMDFYCSRCKKPGYEAALDALAKLLGNGGYGKFAQNPLRGKFYWITDPEMPEGCVPLVEGDPDCQVWFKEEAADAPFILPQISARITALARVLLHRFAMEALRRVLRECQRCHSKVTFAPVDALARSRKGAPVEWLRRGSWLDAGGSGAHGDHESPDRIRIHTLSCPCGGALETRSGRVYYMDTDAIKTDVMMPSGAELGEWKDEVPRYSGFIEGRFYGPKLYRLSVDADYRDLPLELRLRMLERDKKYLSKLNEEERDRALEGIDPKSKKQEPWSQVKAKGMGKDNRTAENLELLYQGALARLAWIADPNNHHPDGALKKMPKELKEQGTVYEKRLEKVGTLARLIKRNKDGTPKLAKTAEGVEHRQSDAFGRGPLLRTVPKRLHLDGAKRLHLGDGTTRPYHIDMRKKLGRAD